MQKHRYYYYYYYYFDPGTQFPGNEKYTLCNTKKYKNQAGTILTPSPPSQNSHAVKLLLLLLLLLGNLLSAGALPRAKVAYSATTDALTDGEEATSPKNSIPAIYHLDLWFRSFSPHPDPLTPDPK